MAKLIYSMLVSLEKTPWRASQRLCGDRNLIDLFILECYTRVRATSLRTDFIIFTFIPADI